MTTRTYIATTENGRYVTVDAINVDWALIGAQEMIDEQFGPGDKISYLCEQNSATLADVEKQYAKVLHHMASLAGDVMPMYSGDAWQNTASRLSTDLRDLADMIQSRLNGYGTVHFPSPAEILENL